MDVEQRLIVSKVIKRFTYNKKKTTFVVEHDIMMATYLADKVIVFEGEPGLECVASRPLSIKEGFNRFLKLLNVTFRKDKSHKRP